MANADGASTQGDFNLTMLDLLPDAKLYWVGNCNELNAGLYPT